MKWGSLYPFPSILVNLSFHFFQRNMPHIFAFNQVNYPLYNITRVIANTFQGTKRPQYVKLRVDRIRVPRKVRA